MQQPAKVREFLLGQILATPGALAVLQKSGQEAGELLGRHASCDWGDLDHNDQKENENGLQHGFRLLSSYRTKAGDKLWIITEWDRSTTTVLLPDEY